MLAAQNSYGDLAEGRHHDPDDDVSKLLVQFYVKGVQDEVKSREAGRPVFVEQHYIRVAAPGDAFNVIDRPINEVDLRRFGVAYQRWKEQGIQADNIGTPLEAWPPLNAAQVAELKYHKINTVEHLAALSDANAQKIGPISQLRQQAKDFVDAAKGQAPLLKVRAENEQVKSELAALKEQFKAQAEALEKLQRNQGGGNGNQQNQRR